jgi:hypothetical protein
MRANKELENVGVRTIGELKNVVIAHALLNGNTFAFHDLFSNLKEFSEGGDDAGVNEKLMSHIGHLIPDKETIESQQFIATLKRVEAHQMKGDIIPASLLEETARNALAREKFAYAEDAYRLLGIKKEMTALCAQRGEQFLREAKPAHAAMSFMIAANIDQPVGPHFQYLGPQLHAECLRKPKACVTILPVENLIDAGIHFLLAHDALAERLTHAAPAEQKRNILGALALHRDENIADLVRNMRKAVDAFSVAQNGKPDDFLAIGSLLLGRPTASGEAWQYLREFSYEHPVGALCVCIRPVRGKPALIPILRENKSLLEFILPPEMLATD